MQPVEVIGKKKKKTRKQRSAESNKIGQESKRTEISTTKSSTPKLTVVIDGTSKNFNTIDLVKNEIVNYKPNINISEIKKFKER